MMWLIVALSAVFVYYDATNNRIGKIPNDRGFANLHAGGWAIATLFLWIIAVPVYLINRKSLIQKAETHPLEAKHKGLVLGVLIGICVLLVLALIAQR
jgi:hypothetical protein